jgi:hypothetical protein
MKIYDVISESSDVTEAPFGLGGKVLNKIGSKIPGAMGAASKARLDVGGEANRLKKDLAAYMAGAGIRRGTLELDQLKDFLDQVGLPTNKLQAQFDAVRAAGSGVDPDAPLQDYEIDKLLLQATQGGFGQQGIKSRRSKFAAPPASPPNPTPPGGGSGGGLPANVSNALSRLNPAQRAAALALLQQGSNP